MRVFSIQHDRQGLSEVERISCFTEGLEERLTSHPGVDGALVLSTCNRVEVLVDGDADVASLTAALGEDIVEPPRWDLYLGEAAVHHLFRVACGLNSMVVGEREITGQLRRALADAQEAGHASLALSIAVEEALKTSRRVANDTNIEATGRSVVSKGLSLVGIADWPATRALVVGTGSYAGAVVAALRARGVTSIAVHSASGRADEFAASHDLECADDLVAAMRASDLVITCRGMGPLIFPQHVHAGMRFLDLSLVRDVDRSVEQMDGVRVVDLETIQGAVEEEFHGDTSRALALVDAGVAKTSARLRARVVDPAVTRLRETVMALVADEVDRLPNRPLTHEDAAYALRRLATRMLHVPSSRARHAAESGRTDEYLLAMHELYGIAIDPDPDRIDTGRCPVTLASVDDLTPANRQEAS